MQFDVMVDWDDVCYPWSRYAHEVCVRAGITNGNEIKSWHFWEDYGCTEQEVWDALTAEEDWLYSQPIEPGVHAALNRIRYMGHRVHIVTARGFGERGEAIKRYTHDQIVREGIPMDTLNFTKHKPSLGFFHFAIDDGIHNYRALDAVGTQVFLRTQPHNLHEPNMRRVPSLAEFADALQVATDAFRKAGV